MSGQAPAQIAVVGIGNPLAGDDGAGVMALRLLRRTCRSVNSSIVFHILQGDLLQMADLLHCARRFVFIDACVGPAVGHCERLLNRARAPQPSLHHGEIGTVMLQLKALELADPFPDFEIYGIGIAFPVVLGERLSAPVRRGVSRIVNELIGRFGQSPASP